MANALFSSALQNITGMPDPLAPSAAPTPAPKAAPTPAGPPTSREAFQQYQGIEKQIGELLPQQREFETMQAADLASREAKKRERGAAALGEYRTAVEAPEMRRERTAYEDASAVPFIPTADNARDLAAFFSLLGVIGTAIGVGGKGSALQAMNAMNGMMEGYRAGRQDLYKKEKDVFDSNVKALKTKIDTINNKMKEIAELAAIDLKKADLEADMLFAQEGADFLKKYKDKAGLAKTIELLQQKSKNAEKLYEFTRKEEDRATEARQRALDRLEQLKYQRGTQVIVQQMKDDRADGKKPDKSKMTQKENDAFNLRERLVPQLEEGIRVIDRINQEGNWPKLTGLLAVDPRAAEFAFKDDEEALSLIRTFAAFRSKEFETAGKALTKTEDKILSPLYRADLRAYEAVRNAMVKGVEEMRKEQAALQKRYPAQQADGSTPAQPQGSQPAASKVMPTGAKLSAYTKAHPEFDGDEEKAKAYLRTQGYQ